MSNDAPNSPGITASEEQSSINDDLLEMEVEMLRAHMGLSRQPVGTPPAKPPRLSALFFVERAPRSNRGSRCKLSIYDNGPIQSGQYRIALNPSMDLDNFMRGREGTADFYHTSCFEKIADFTQISFLNRVSPVTRKPRY